MIEGGDEEAQERPIGDLLGQLVDEGKAYARAELGLARVTAEAKAEAARKPALLAAGALLLLVAGVVVLAMTLALALATLVGPLAGGLIAAIVTLAAAYSLFLLAKQEAGKIP